MSTTPFPKLEPTKHVFTVTECIDDVGRRIVQREVIVGEEPPGFIRFVGMNQIMVKYARDLPPQPSQYRFPIEGVRTLEEAFGRWDECSESYGKMHVVDLERQVSAMRQTRESELVVPDASAARRILES